MTDTNCIIDEINRLMVIAFPSAGAHINACPEEFARPAYLIRQLRTDQTDINRSTVQISGQFEIIFKAPLDEHYLSDAAVLNTAQDTILKVFKKGYISVGERKIKVKASTGGVDGSETSVNVKFEYFDARSDETDNTPKMAALTTNTILRKEWS